jgi:hypothetical protein
MPVQLSGSCACKLQTPAEPIASVCASPSGLFWRIQACTSLCQPAALQRSTGTDEVVCTKGRLIIAFSPQLPSLPLLVAWSSLFCSLHSPAPRHSTFRHLTCSPLITRFITSPSHSFNRYHSYALLSRASVESADLRPVHIASFLLVWLHSLHCHPLI